MTGSSLRATCAAAAAVGLSCVLLVATSTFPVYAAEIKLLGPLAMRGPFADLVPQFENSSGHKAVFNVAAIGAITDRLMKGEVMDVAIVSGAQNEELQKQGKLLAGSRSDIARVGFSAFVRTGTPKPDLGSVDALKRALLAAKSIAYTDPAGGTPGGVYMEGLIQRLGIAADMKVKTRLVPPGGSAASAVVDAVVKGEVEIGFAVASDAVIVVAGHSQRVAGLDSIPLPAEVQSYTLYAAGIGASSKQVDAAKSLITFLSSPTAKRAFTATGFEPQ